MNMNMIMQQAKKMQKEMEEAQNKVAKQTFIGKQDLVEVEVTGEQVITSVKILNNDITSDDIEILEDMILLATNDAIKQSKDAMQKELGKFGNGIPGLF